MGNLVSGDDGGWWRADECLWRKDLALHLIAEPSLQRRLRFHKSRRLAASDRPAELIAIGEGTPESLAAIEMIIMATGACSEVSTLEIVDSKSMTAAMETANKVVSAYQAPNK